MSKMVAHAESELKRTGLLDKGSDYDGMLGRAVLELVKCHAKQGHSGYSHQAAIALFTKLANFETI